MKTIVITGASSGIGLVTGEYLASRGYKVYGLSRTEMISDKIHYISCDVTNKEAVVSAFNEIKEDIYAVINNAGMGISGAVEYQEKQEIEKIINVNIMGVINVSQVGLPFLRKTKGRIINVGSVAGELAIPFQTFYSMTKAAVTSFSEALSGEVRPFGIKVTTVLPGDTKTSFTKNREKSIVPDNLYKERLEKSIARMEKDEQNGKNPISVSKVIYKVLRKKNPPLKVTVGFTYKLLVFLKRILPIKFVNYIIYRMYAGK